MENQADTTTHDNSQNHIFPNPCACTNAWVHTLVRTHIQNIAMQMTKQYMKIYLTSLAVKEI